MATSDFKIFANGQSLVGEEVLNIAPLDDEQLVTETKTGFYSGLASSKKFNRVLRQGTAGTATLADFITSALNEDVKDNGKSFAEQLRLAIGASLYPVGSIYMSVNSTDPSTLFGGEWEALDEGRVLIGANSTYSAGSKGGEATHTLTVEEMPTHGHDGVASSAGEHTHTRGSQNITGAFGSGGQEHNTYVSGAFYKTGGSQNNADSGNTNADVVGLDASRTWEGESSSDGAHTHEVSVSNTGGDMAHNNMQPYLSVYMWKRVA